VTIKGSTNSLRNTVVLVAAAAAFLLVPIRTAAQTRKPKQGSGTTKPVPAAVSPLRQGEVLDYTASFLKLSNAATIRLSLNERRDFYGRPAWHLQAFAHTLNPLRMLFELDDQFDSYSDVSTLACLQYELHLHERGQTVDSVLRMTTGKEPVPSAQRAVAAARVLPGTRDPLGMTQFLRTVDWTKTKEVRSPVYDGRQLYDVVARLVEPAARVQVPAGTYSVSKIELRVFERGVELKDTHFTLSLTNDAARTPVLLEAEMPFGSAQVQLTRSQ
jgi:hypothetical protein